MPEGLEVRRLALQMSEEVGSLKLLDIIVESGRYTKKAIEGMKEFLEDTPAQIKGVGVHGKLLYFLFDSEWAALSTLGMTGSWSREPSKHTRLKFVLENGPLYYNDTRNFGTLKFVKGSQKIIDKLDTLGPDLLAEECDDDLFAARIKSKPNKTIAEVLMDQTIVSGIGNYVKAEALHLAKVSPHRTCGSLTDADLYNLNTAVRSVLMSSFESGGATIQSYKDFHGNVGTATQNFAVYGQKKDPLGNTVIKEKTKDGRTTHWVPEVQE